MAVDTAHAATSTQNVPVTATVNSNCRVTAPSAVAFGVVDVNPAGATPLAAAGQVTVTCNKGAVVALTVDNGLHGTWRMLNGANSDTLAYTLVMPTNFTVCPAAGSGSNWTSVDMAPAYISTGGPQNPRDLWSGGNAAAAGEPRHLHRHRGRHRDLLIATRVGNTQRRLALTNPRRLASLVASGRALCGGTPDFVPGGAVTVLQLDARRESNSMRWP